jgi:hypothetical protein
MPEEGKPRQSPALPGQGGWTSRFRGHYGGVSAWHLHPQADDLVTALGAASGISKSEVSRSCADLDTGSPRSATGRPRRYQRLAGWPHSGGRRSKARLRSRSAATPNGSRPLPLNWTGAGGIRPGLRGGLARVGERAIQDRAGGRRPHLRPGESGVRGNRVGNDLRRGAAESTAANIGGVPSATRRSSSGSAPSSNADPPSALARTLVKRAASVTLAPSSR